MDNISDEQLERVDKKWKQNVSTYQKLFHTLESRLLDTIFPHGVFTTFN
ncbi:hypothetical protein [Metabacillus malikii]|nr:hypothetical protein [Metabacillus malikii]